MVERSDRMCSTGEGNGKPLQYSCLENPISSMKRQNDRTLKDELPGLVGTEYATRNQCPIFLPFHTVHGVLKVRILKWFAIPFSSGPRFVRSLHMTHPSCVALQDMAYSFIELDRLWPM